MMNYDYDLIIVGGGLAGLSAAIEAEKGELKTLLIEKSALGGLAFNGGDIILNHVYARLKHGFPEGSDIKQELLRDLGEKMSHYVNEYSSFLTDNKYVTLEIGTAEVISNHEVLVDSKTYSARKIILSFGAIPETPFFKGVEEGRKSGFIKTATQILDHTFKEQTIVIYGGGKIAVEFAIFTASIGIKTYILVRSQFLKDLDQDAKEAYLKLIASPVLVMLEEAVITKVDGQNVTYTKDGQENVIIADSLLLATGSLPNLLPIQKLNLALDSRGIIVNDYMETSLPNVYAIGDTNMLPKYSNMAMTEAIIAIKHITGSKITYNPADLIKHSVGLIQYSFVGESEESLRARGVAIETKVIELDSRVHNLFFFKVITDKITRQRLRIVVISKNSNRDLNDIQEMLENDFRFVAHNQNNLFSASYHIKRLFQKALITRDENLITSQHEVYYQPKVSAMTHKTIGAELLSRFKIDGRFVSPLPFINDFEQHKTIVNLDLKMLEEGAKFLKKGLKENMFPPEFALAINFSPTTINTINPLKLRAILRKHGVEPRRIYIELTERILGDNAINLEHLRDLKDYGFKLSMDDFSIGNSSVNVLNTIDFDEVKIDMSLVPDNEHDLDRIITFDSVVKLLESKHKEIIVEGVETLEQVKLLDQRNLKGYQGYYFSRPINRKDFLTYLSTYRN